MSITDAVLARAQDSYTKKSNVLPIAIQKHEMVSAKTARLLVKIENAHLHRANENEIAETVSAKLKARYLPNSFAKTEHEGLYTIFVNSTNKTKTKAEVASSQECMREVAANVFRDDDDCIWRFIEDANGGYFLADDVEDFSSVLSNSRGAIIATASVGATMEETYSAGDPVLFYDEKEEEKRFAVGVDGSTVYDPEADKIVSVSPATVYAVGESPIDVDTKEVAAMTSESKKALLEYYRRLYGHNKAYFDKVKKIIDNMVG